VIEKDVDGPNSILTCSPEISPLEM
jgi:hypothetical protein